MKKGPLTLLIGIIVVVVVAIVVLVSSGPRKIGGEDSLPPVYDETQMSDDVSDALNYPPADDAPEVAAADQYIIDQVGEEYFKDNYTLFTSEFQGDTYEHWVTYEYAHPAEYSGEEEFVVVYVGVDDDFNITDVAGEVACFYADAVCDVVPESVVLDVLRNTGVGEFLVGDLQFVSSYDKLFGEDNFGQEWMWYVETDGQIHMVDAATGNYIGSETL